MPTQGSVKLDRLFVTADEDEFDPIMLQHFHDEGFEVTYLSWQGGGKAYRNELAHLADDLEFGETYAIVAFASAAADCLDFHMQPEKKLAALIAYYPDHIPSPRTKYPSHLDVWCHIAGSQLFAPAFNSYNYPDTRPGFAEYDLEEFDKVAASLAWTRTLGTLRRAFKQDHHALDLERIREEQISKVQISKNAMEVARVFVEDGYVNHVPTMTGGVGKDELFLFYQDQYIAKSPPSLNMKLVSRTAGVDRIVDEFVVSFKHTHEVPWILPGVKPTNRPVYVGLVSIVCVRGGMIYSEHVYWDQASVLCQVGLLDPDVVPAAFQEQGLIRLPICGTEGAAKVLDEESQASNSLIPDWRGGRSQGRPADLPTRPKQVAANGARQDEA